MNKYILIPSLVALSFFLTACTQTQTTTTQTSDNTQQDQKQEQKNVFTTVKDAVSRQLALKCEYTDEDKEKIDTYIKGDQVYLESQPTIDQGSGDQKRTVLKGIIKGDTFWVWEDGTDKGLKTTLSSGDGASMGEQKVRSVSDVINVLETKKENCMVASVPDSKFDIPSNVTFVEF